MSTHNLPATSHESHAESHGSTLPYWITMGLLMLLLGATVFVAEMDVGAWNLPLALSIATAKALLILYVFMHVGDSKPLIWLFAAAGFFWLAVLMVLTLSDFWTRNPLLP
jgi:cytochrome c oxidase subunit IV